MTVEPYLIRLGNRLRDGLEGLGADRRERHRSFIVSQQAPDGGFSGRQGDSDLYYTGFAVRCLAMLGGLSSDECERITSFLSGFAWNQLDVVDLVNWLYASLAVQAFGGADPLTDTPSDWPEQMASRLESVRADDGGYTKTSRGAVGSTYHSFLVATTYELLGKPLPNPDAFTHFLKSRQREDGGFVEIAQMRRSGTNPTAAAVAALTMFDAFAADQYECVHQFFRKVVSADSGFRANTRIPFADGLSTFTGLLTCQDLGLSDVVNQERVESLVASRLELPSGGFRGGSWDDSADVEYTFYGLGVLSLLS